MNGNGKVNSKVAAATAGAALGQIVGWVVGVVTGLEVPELIGGAFSTLGAFFFGYFMPTK